MKDPKPVVLQFSKVIIIGNLACTCEAKEEWDANRAIKGEKVRRNYATLCTISFGNHHMIPRDTYLNKKLERSKRLAKNP